MGECMHENVLRRGSGCVLDKARNASEKVKRRS
jgi:hypothetical protein